MKKALLASLLSICMALLIATAYLLINPFPVFAATGSANCGDGTSIQCSMDGSAVRCDCKDGVGCTAYYADGKSVERKCVNSYDGGGIGFVESAQ